MKPVEVKIPALQALMERRANSAYKDKSVSGSYLRRLSGHNIREAAYLEQLEALVKEGLLVRAAHGKTPRYEITDAEFSQVMAALSLNDVSPTTISEKRRIEIIAKISNLKAEIEFLPLTQQERSQAHVLVASSLLLSEAPTPPWQVIKDILVLVAAISAPLALALQIADFIR